MDFGDPIPLFHLHFRTKDTRRGKYQNSTVEIECTTKKEQNVHKNKKKTSSTSSIDYAP